MCIELHRKGTGQGYWVMYDRKLNQTFGPRFTTQVEAVEAMVKENDRLETWAKGEEQP